MPSTPTAVSASRTSSSLKGLITALIIFMAWISFVGARLVVRRRERGGAFGGVTAHVAAHARTAAHRVRALAVRGDVEAFELLFVAHAERAEHQLQDEQDRERHRRSEDRREPDALELDQHLLGVARDRAFGRSAVH